MMLEENLTINKYKLIIFKEIIGRKLAEKFIDWLTIKAGYMIQDYLATLTLSLPSVPNHVLVSSQYLSPTYFYKYVARIFCLILYSLE